MDGTKQIEFKLEQQDAFEVLQLVREQTFIADEVWRFYYKRLEDNLVEQVRAYYQAQDHEQEPA